VKLIIEPEDGIAPLLSAIKGAKKSVEIAIFRFDRRVLYVLSFNFTRLDIGHSRGFGVVTSQAAYLQEAARLFKADCTRTRYAPKGETFVVSPMNSRHVLGTFLKRAKKQLLIYDPKISDKEMLQILRERAKAGVEVKIIGQVSGGASFDVHKLAGMRLHTRTIIRDRHQAFVGSQSLRAAELDSRRELGLIVKDQKTVKKLIDTFESDWTSAGTRVASTPAGAEEAPADTPTAASSRDVSKAVKVFTKELQPLATTVKKAVRRAVIKAGEDVLHDKDVKDTMKNVVKQAVKEAVKEAVHDAQDAVPPTKVA
jgi:phosphatidylserine/phosphatidylglycerophosphate/cardiolipin synthase-like enzyme